MKKYIPILLIAPLLLSACSIDWNGDKDNKIAELEKRDSVIDQKEQDLFKKKQECFKYRDEMSVDLKKRFTGVFEEYALKEEYFTINDIFYSPIQNSCFYK